MKADIIYTQAGQRVVKNVEGSNSRYYPAYEELSIRAEVFTLTQQDKNEILNILLNDLLDLDLQIEVKSEEQWNKIVDKFYKQITYGAEFKDFALDGSGEFNRGIVKFKPLQK